MAKIFKLENYFTPVDILDIKAKNYQDEKLTIKNKIEIYKGQKKFKKLESFDILFFSLNNTSSHQVRKEFYSLSSFVNNVKIADLGLLKSGKSKKDKVAAIREVIIELCEFKKTIIILGEEKFLSYSVYDAYEFKDNDISIVEISPMIKFKNTDEDVSEEDILNKIILNKRHRLFHFTNIAYQSHYTNESIIDLLNKHSWEAHRLTKIKSQINATEYLLRNSEFISIDLSSIRHIDATDVVDSVPNGLSAYEICKLAYYAGISDDSKILGLWNLLPNLKEESLTTKLTAQVIWYYLSGFSNRFNDFPDEINNRYKKITVPIENTDINIVFYNNRANNRWWFEVPLNDEDYLVPCSEDEYIETLKGDVPTRWIKFFNKI
jgi:hypothetical protein